MKKFLKTYSVILVLFILCLSTITLLDTQKKRSEKRVKEAAINLDSAINETNNISIEEQNKEKTLEKDISESEKETNYIKPISYMWPLQGNIIVDFSPTQIVYDEILDQYRTSNSVILKTQQKEIVATCDGKITSITTSPDSQKEITITTTDNHTITLKGYIENLNQKEGNVILKGSTMGKLKLNNDFGYLEIIIKKDNEYLNPNAILNSY